MKQPLDRLALFAGLAMLALAPAALRHRFFWGGELAPYLHVFELVSLLTAQGAGLWVLWRALRLVDAGRGDLRAIWRGTLWIALASLFVLPLLSDDVFAYDLRGRILSVHGGNPYVDVATQYADAEPRVDLGNRWHGYPNPYGPLFTLWQAGVAWVSQLLPASSPDLQQLSSVAFYKLLAILALLAGARSLLSWTEDPKGQQRILLCTLWNPLLWLEGVVNAHNDLLLGVAVVLALTSLRQRRFGHAAFWLWMGAQVKFVSLALGPLFFVLALRERRTKSFLLGNVAGALPFAALGALFWSGPGGLDWLTQQGQLQGASLQLLLMNALDAAGLASALVPKLLPLLAVAYAFYAAVRCPDVQQAPIWSARALFVLVFVGLIWAGPWYHLWWLPLAWTPAFLPGRPARVLMLTVPLGYGVYLATRSLGPAHEWSQWALTMLLPAVAFAASRRCGSATTPPQA